MIPALITALTGYVNVLTVCMETTDRAEDRTMYVRHLAAAAQMFAAAEKPDLKRLEILVVEERRQYGISFLSGEVGEKAEAAFANLEADISTNVSRANPPVIG